MSFLKTPYPYFILFVILLCKSLIQEEVHIYLLEPEYHILLANFKEIGILYPEVAAVQALHESDFMKSNIFKINNNLFGLKNHTNTTYCISSNMRPDSVLVDSVMMKVNTTHCWYSHSDHSILDYQDYQERRIREYEECTGKRILTLEDFLFLLENLKLKKRYGCDETFRYATDPEYVTKLRKYLKRYDAI